MRPGGRRDNELEQSTGSLDRQARAQRGAWYADPFEQAGERWWDGRGWTDQVRNVGNVGHATRATQNVRIAGAGRIDAPTRAGDNGQRASFLPIDRAVGQMARLVPTGATAEHPPWGLLGRHQSSYALLSTIGTIATISFGGRSESARMACADGEWCLRRRRWFGSELEIETPGGHPAGSYVGRRDPSGGVIAPAGGSEFELRRMLSRGWRLRGSDPELLVDIQPCRSLRQRRTAVVIRSFPRDGVGAHIALLTSCAVLLLDRALAPPGGG